MPRLRLKPTLNQQLHSIILPVPLHKPPQSLPQIRLRFKTAERFQGLNIRVGSIDIAGLHGEEILFRFSAEKVFQGFNEGHELDRRVVSDVVEGIRRRGLIRSRMLQVEIGIRVGG